MVMQMRYVDTTAKYSPVQTTSDAMAKSPQNMVSSSLKNSPTSAWWNTMIPVGSSFLVSNVERAVTPKPWVSDTSVKMIPFQRKCAYVVTSAIEDTHQWNIRHAVHHHALMFRCILGDPPQVCFDHMVAI